MIDLNKDEIYKRKLAKEIAPQKTTDMDKKKKQEEPKEQLIKEAFPGKYPRAKIAAIDKQIKTLKTGIKKINSKKEAIVKNYEKLVSKARRTQPQYLGRGLATKRIAIVGRLENRLVKLQSTIEKLKGKRSKILKNIGKGKIAAVGAAGAAVGGLAVVAYKKLKGKRKKKEK